METLAAVVSSFDRPPRYESFDLPSPSNDDEVVLDVLAVGLHPRVRTGASGKHYTSTGKLPMVPGVDGVGRLPDGRLVYFVADDELTGSMAARTVVDARRCIPLPDGVDVVKIAAAMNPAMSSWVALRRRVPIKPGQSVLVLGATGNAGQMAVQVAKRLGAGRVVGAGRDERRLALLPGLGADQAVGLEDAALAKAAADDPAGAEPLGDLDRARGARRPHRARHRGGLSHTRGHHLRGRPGRPSWNGQPEP
jgi:NADPH:quinone reductase-like Zn-dependent oxidoreductase